VPLEVCQKLQISNKLGLPVSAIFQNWECYFLK
jgi:hypothetical protein